MRVLLAALLLVGQGCLTACTTSGASEQLDDFSSSLRGGFGRNTDTLGTNRRVDVYGGSTAPSLPTSSGGSFR